MIDGKIATIVTDTPSAATCNICLAKPSEMNDLARIFSRPVQDEVYKYGLSTLHMWIRCLECLLHISYNLDFKMWSARAESLLSLPKRWLSTQTYGDEDEEYQ
ncbi:hypothetical protein ACJJTC_013065, partial [Scirpophaga incertulas]